MPRVKRGKTRTSKRSNILKHTKGYKWGRKKLTRQAKTAAKLAGAHAYRDRRAKKRTMRRLWQIRLNAAVRQYDLSYSQFIALLKQNKIDINRKILSEIAQHQPQLFEAIIKQLKK